jgi:alanine dehydrogenase
VLDKDINALRRVQQMTADEIPTMIATRQRIEKALAFADLLVCAVAVHGERTPILVTRDMLKLMKPRSVIMDLSIDQGGCCETSRPTDFSNPTYEIDGIIHFCVPNLPSTASRASTRSLTNSMLPYVEEIADKGFDRAIRENSALCRGTYTYDGHCLRKGVARIFDVPHYVVDGT